MGWREDYRKASYKGVTFLVRNHESGSGRRNAKYEYPGRDVPSSEDLGRKARSYSIEAYILGDDYFEARDALLAACENEGAGELIHPYLGTLQVVCDEVSLRESTEEGRMATFSLRFTEAGEDIYPEAAAEVKAEALSAKQNLLDSATESFTDKFSLSGLPSFAVDSAIGIVEGLADTFENVTAGIRQAAEDAAALGYKIRQLKAKASDLVQSPLELANFIKDSYATLSAAATFPEDLFAGYKKNASDEQFQRTTQTTASTSTREREYDNNESLKDLIRRIILAEMIVPSSDSSYTSYQDAITARSDYIDLIDSEIENIGFEDDDVYQSLIDLRSTATRLIPNEDQDLPFIREVTPSSTTSSILLSYDLYESLDNEADIIARNKIRHPGFITGGKKVEVLSE